MANGAKNIRSHYDFGKVSEIRNGVFHLLNAAPSSPVQGQFYYDTGLSRFRGYHGAAEGWQSFLPASTRLDQITAPTANVNMNSQRIVSLANAVSDQDAVTLAQMRLEIGNVASGLDAKPSVLFATTGNINLSGVGTQAGGEWTTLLTVGDRILVKNQTNSAQNGIYVAQSGAWTRAEDMDSWAEVPGAFVFIERGATQADTGWVSTADPGGTIGTTAITWTQFSTQGNILGGAGLTKTGNTLDVVAAAGSGIVVNPDNIDLDPVNGVPVNRGGTGAITPAGAKANLGFLTKFAATIGDGAATSYTVTHNLNSRDVAVTLYDATAFDEVEADVVHTTVNALTVNFTSAPASNSIRVVVVG